MPILFYSNEIKAACNYVIIILFHFMGKSLCNCFNIHVSVDFKPLIHMMVSNLSFNFVPPPTVDYNVVLFALNANSLNRAPVLQALCIVSQAWSTMKIPLRILTKFHIVWM